MESTTKIGIAGTAGIVAATALVIAIGGGGSTQPGPVTPACHATIGDTGQFTAEGDDCRLDFLVPGKRECRVRPVVRDSIEQQWMYKNDDKALVVRGLRRGQTVSYECK